MCELYLNISFFSYRTWNADCGPRRKTAEPDLTDALVDKWEQIPAVGVLHPFGSKNVVFIVPLH